MFRFALLAALVRAGFGGPAFGQTFTWNNTGGGLGDVRELGSTWRPADR